MPKVVKYRDGFRLVIQLVQKVCEVEHVKQGEVHNKQTDCMDIKPDGQLLIQVELYRL